MIATNMFIDEVHDKLKDILSVNALEETVRGVLEVASRYEVSIVEQPSDKEDFMIDLFLNALSVEGRSHRTIKHYRYVLGRFLKAVGVGVGAVTTHHIRKYISDEKTRGIADGTLRGVRDVFNSFFGWLTREGMIRKNPMANVGTIKCQKKVRKAYSEADIERLKVHCRTRKEKAIVCFLLATGCRVGETVRLNRDEVDMERMECIVLGKGNKERTVYLDQVAVMTLQEYLSERKDDNPALFLNRFGKRLGTGGIQYLLKAIGKRAVVEHVHPHKFRRTLATDLIKHGMPIQEVATILGHDKLDTTMMYVAMDQKSIESSYRKYS